MKIKTFPLQFVEDKLTEINKAAAERNMTTKDFILNAIETQLIKKGE